MMEPKCHICGKSENIAILITNVDRAKFALCMEHRYNIMTSMEAILNHPAIVNTAVEIDWHVRVDDDEEDDARDASRELKEAYAFAREQGYDFGSYDI